MNRRLLFISAAALALFPAAAASAQDDKSYEVVLQRQAKSLPAIREAAVAATGYDEASIEVKPGPHQLFVTVVNSKLVGASSAARVDEASTISSAVARVLAGRPEFDDVEVLHVDYVRREQEGGRAEMVQAIDFRKDPDGRFRHHVS